MMQGKEDYSSFKIKKKIRKDSISSNKNNNSKELKNKKEENIIKLKIKSLNYKEIFEKIWEEASKNNESLEIIKSIITEAVNQLELKNNIYKKKWKFLRSSNYDENDYRKYENKLKKEEKDDITMIKKEIIKKLSMARIWGFNTKEYLLEKEFQKYKNKNYKYLLENNLNIKNFQINSDSYKNYKESQYNLLEKMMKTNIFIDPNKNINDYKKHSNNNNNQLNIDSNERENYNNDKKNISIKLTNILENFDFNLKNEDKKEIKDEDKLDINIDLYNKIKEAKNEKSYYKKKLVKNQFKDLKNFILRSKNFKNIDEISNKDLQNIVDLVSFCSNSIHYYIKFNKKQFIIHPDDILKIINNLLKDK